MSNHTETIALTRGFLSKKNWSFPRPEGNPSITLHHGTRSCQLDVSRLHDNENDVLSLADLCHSLLLPKHLTEYKIRPLNSHNYQVGPLVGILISETKYNKLLMGRVDPVYRRFAQFLQLNKGLAVFLCLNRILWDKDAVIGVVRLTTGGQEKWIMETLPIPSVIYDRCFGSDNRVRRKIFRKKCATHYPAIRVINSLIKIGKFQIYTLCSQITRFQQYLPSWDIVSSENIDIILEKFPVAYLKPDSLSKGQGVTKVSSTPLGYVVEQCRESSNYVNSCDSPEEVLQELEPYISKEGFMVVQEAIPLMSWQGRPFDFRLLLQKDKSGTWKRTGVAGRISGKGSIISSPRSGGTVSTYEEVMADQGQHDPGGIAVTLVKLALDLANTLDKLIGPFAEIGFDLGVDITGEVKIIEVNGMPLKVSIERLNNSDITQLAFENPMGYAIYLAGFGGLYYD